MMKTEFVLDKSNIRNIIKSLTAFEGKTLTQLKVLLNHKFQKTDTLENMTNKLRNQTFRVSEMLEVLDVLGYEMIVRKK